MMRHRLNEPNFDYTPTSSHNLKTRPLEPVVSERRWGLCGLVLSLIVIICKVYWANREYVKDAMVEPYLVSYDVLTEEGQVMFRLAWKNSIKYSGLWLPALCGILTTYFTWLMVYLDSSQPGVQPPSPFSPSKYKDRSGHSFHLNYVFAVVVGVLVATYMYWKKVSIVY